MTSSAAYDYKDVQHSVVHIKQPTADSSGDPQSVKPTPHRGISRTESPQAEGSWDMFWTFLYVFVAILYPQ